MDGVMVEEIRTEDGGVVAREVEVADTLPARMRGLMFRRSIPEDYALVFDFGREKRDGVHMLFVPFDTTVLFLDSDKRVRKAVELSAWTGFTFGKARWVVEMPAGKSDLVRKGEKLVFE